MENRPEVAPGNVLGSNIYNMVFIAGVTGAIAPTPVPESILRVDLPVLIGISLAIKMLAYTVARLSRREGLLMIGNLSALSRL